MKARPHPDDWSVPPSACPHCGVVQPMAFAVPGQERGRPESGALSLCADCGNLSKFGDKLELVALTQAERKDIEASPTAGRIIAAQIAILLGTRKGPTRCP